MNLGSTITENVLERLQRDGLILFSEIATVSEMNALRDLTKRGLAEFRHFSAGTAAYVLTGRSLLKVLP